MRNFVCVVELIPESYVGCLDVEKIFGRVAPLHVDLGCGDGMFLCDLAKRMPERNFLGIERLLGRVRSASHKTAGVNNVRVLRAETSYAVRYLLPKNSVEIFHLLFPDPWPKRRHHQRRIFTANFMSAIAAALMKNGVLRVATDESDYFKHIAKLAGQSREFAVSEVNDHCHFPVSTFEKKFKNNGVNIHRLELRKISPVR